MKRQIIRQFIDQMEWITPDNASYLIDGDFSPTLYRKWQKTLEVMTFTQNKDKALRKVKNTGGSVAYTLYRSKRNGLPYNNYWHDRRLRNCMAKFIHTNGNHDLDLNTYADTQAGSLYFEFDSGSETTELIDKIKRYYCGQGVCRAIFFMAHRDNIERLEKNRLDYLFDIVAKLLRHKPNRVLANTYTSYLKTGKLYNFRREEKSPTP